MKFRSIEQTVTGGCEVLRAADGERCVANSAGEAEPHNPVSTFPKVHRIVTAAMATCLVLSTVQPVLAAPMAYWSHSASDKAPTAKPVSFQVRNDSGAALTISTGDQQYTIQPHRTIKLKLQEGTQVTAINSTSHVQAGAVVTTVTSQLRGNTLAIS